MNAPSALRTCTTCHEPKPLDDFHRQALGRGGKASVCKVCACEKQKRWRETNRAKEAHREYERQWRMQNPEKYAARKLRMRLARYSLTVDQYMAMLLEQGGACAACETPDPGHAYGQFHVDHDHSCCPGKWSCGSCIRGLLCHGCNAAMGNVGDDVARLRKLIDYLSRARPHDA